MLANIFRGRKVFITGHTGFKGSWLTAWLISLGAEVTGFSLDIPTQPSCFAILGLHSRINDLRGDIRNLQELQAAIKNASPEFVFHLAAQALVRTSYTHPVETFTTNAIGTLNILESLRSTDSVKAAVIITSDKCYRNEEWVFGYREIDRLGGNDPYSASKGCAEFISHSYFSSFFASSPACATARAGNVIGGGDWAKDRIVPDCARAWFENRSVEIRSPLATRPWQHVLEPLSGYLWLAGCLANPSLAAAPIKGASFNFGPPADGVYPVAEVVKALEKHWSKFQYQVSFQPDAPKESGLLKLCCDKALVDLHWRATWDFEETIRSTADWYARYKACADGMWEYTQGQIAAYCNTAQQRNLLWSCDAGIIANSN